MTATTSASGAFSFASLPIGAYELTFSLAGYVTQTVTAAVNLSGPTTLSPVAMVAETEPSDSGPPDADSGAPPVTGPPVSVSDVLNAGFNAPVTVTATVTGTDSYTYAWTQTSGPTLTLTGANTASVSFTTPEFVVSLGYNFPDGITDGGIVLNNARCGVRGIDRDQAATPSSRSSSPTPPRAGPPPPR